MPRTLKRRSEAITNDDTSAYSDPDEPPTRRRRRRSSIAASSSSAASTSASPSPDVEQARAQFQSNTQTLVKKLVRLALSSEYARLPLRRSDISQKILKENNASHRQFKPAFEGAQKVLRTTFGMTLVELPSKDKTTLKDRRTQATQTQKSQQASGGVSSSSSNKSWILVSTLPKQYKQSVEICPPSRAPSQAVEAEYTALYTFVLALIYLNGSVLSDAKLERYLKRMNADEWTPTGPTDKLLQRMVKEGYVEKRRDTSTGEEIVEWVIGPRGKVEVGVRGVANLVKGVYGFGVQKPNQDEGSDEGDEGAENGDTGTRRVKMEEEELDRRLERSLGFKLPNDGETGGEEPPQEADVENVRQDVERPRRGRPRKINAGGSDDD